MPSEVPLVLQTAYAELLDRAASASFGEAFADDGAFVAKTIRGRRYWYFQAAGGIGRKQKYVGPETPEILDRIARHKEKRDDERDRRALVSTLIRSANLPRPMREIGEVVAALADAGIFRLRAVLIGTIAYQTYPAMLGQRLPIGSLQTEDVDIAQFADVSIAVGDRTPPMLEVLKGVDASFQEVPDAHDARRTTMYRAASGVRVDFLTPNRGPETDAPRALPALGTDAQPLRFLDFLIREPEPAVVLHGAGIHVLVPTPQRYALHKLIVARRRGAGSAKTDKDLAQAASLFEILARKRAHELRASWEEAISRGKTWRRLLGEGLGLLDAKVRDRTLKVVGAARSIVPELDLRFAARPARYDRNRMIVSFVGVGGAEEVSCAVSHEAIEDNFRSGPDDRRTQLELFRDNRAKIEALARTKYLRWPIEEPNAVLIRSEEVPKLLREGARKP